MNTNDTKIVVTALENLKRNTGFIGKWEQLTPKALDGKITFVIDNEFIEFNIEVKDTLRNFQLPAILKQNQNNGPLMVIARHIFPKIKEELKNLNVAYMEANGNLFLKQNGTTIWLDGQKPIQAAKENRAFTNTGLKFLFPLLLDEHLINLPYREIAKVTHIAFGNINYILTDLKQNNFIIKNDDKTYALNNKKELLAKWMADYEDRLKPKLLLGTFRFTKKETFDNWKNIKLKKGETKWGAEPAGALLTDYLHPEVLTLYTTEPKKDLMKNYRLIPDEYGNIKIYQKFWEANYTDNDIVPPLLAYTDLMNAGDRRQMETGQKIYDAYLRNQF